MALFRVLGRFHALVVALPSRVDISGLTGVLWAFPSMCVPTSHHMSPRGTPQGVHKCSTGLHSSPVGVSVLLHNSSCVGSQGLGVGGSQEDLWRGLWFCFSVWGGWGFVAQGLHRTSTRAPQEVGGLWGCAFCAASCEVGGFCAGWGPAFCVASQFLLCGFTGGGVCGSTRALRGGRGLCILFGWGRVLGFCCFFFPVAVIDCVSWDTSTSSGRSAARSTR